MSAPAGTARERTRLAADRTVLSACALAAALIKIGFAHGRALDVAAGCVIGGVALLAPLRSHWRGPGRLALMSGLVAVGGLLLMLQAVL